jgi:hypothetical protein
MGTRSAMNATRSPTWRRKPRTHRACNCTHKVDKRHAQLAPIRLALREDPTVLRDLPPLHAGFRKAYWESVWRGPASRSRRGASERGSAGAAVCVAFGRCYRLARALASGQVDGYVQVTALVMRLGSRTLFQGVIAKASALSWAYATPVRRSPSAPRFPDRSSDRCPKLGTPPRLASRRRPRGLKQLLNAGQLLKDP